MHRLPKLTVSVVREGYLTSEEKRIRSPRNIAEILYPMVATEDRELFIAVHLDTRNNVRGIVTVSVGDLSSSIVHPREVFRAAIVAGAAAVIVAHNHPSGDPAPSPEDAAVTKRLYEAGQLLGIELLDHVIIGHHLPGTDALRYKSLKELGIF